jgi:hypothetical protein
MAIPLLQSARWLWPVATRIAQNRTALQAKIECRFIFANLGRSRLALRQNALCNSIAKAGAAAEPPSIRAPEVSRMLPRLSHTPPPASLYAELLAELRVRGFEGDLAPGYGDRVVSATDNSIYQLFPQAIAFPRTTDDLARIARVVSEPRFKGVVLAPRGGGTAPTDNR